MNTPTEREPENNGNQAQPVPSGDLKASDFFPPGMGWNQDDQPERDQPPQVERKPEGESH